MSSRFFALLAVCNTLYLLHASEVTVTIEPNTQPVFFIKGRPLTLTCMVHGDMDVKISWRKNEDPIDEHEYQIETWTSEGTKGPTRNVRLSKSVAGDSDIASFRCSAGITDQIVQTSNFYVFTRDANITEGSTTTLTCKPELDYSDKTVTWYKGGVLLEEIPDLKGRLEFSNDTVSFRDTKLTDSGVYVCRLEVGPIKEISQTFQENVVLQGKPYIANWDTPEMNQHVTNTSIVLKCPAGGYPVPEVFWFRENEVLESTDRIHMTSLDGLASGRLEIFNSTDDDLGQYSCAAENALGRASFTFDLKDRGLGNSAVKPGLNILDVCAVFLYISIVATAGSWTR